MWMRTKAGSPEAIATPVAIPTTEPSCRPSTKRRSSGRPASSGTSVEPGLEKIVSRPRARRTSNVASRTVRAAFSPAASGAVRVASVLTAGRLPPAARVGATQVTSE